jgi:hypothetical protein
MSAIELAEALQAKLIADTSEGTFYDAVGGRIYQAEAPENLTSYPYCVWQFLGSDQLRCYGSVMMHVANIQFDLYGTKVAGITALGDIETKLFTLLEGVSLTPTGFDRGKVLFTRRGETTIDEDAIRVMSEATITGTDH